MKLRLFWIMLLAFVLVIVLGVCGMLGFFGLAFAGVWQPEEFRSGFQGAQKTYVATLADYYVAHDGSWSGVEQRLNGSPFGGPTNFLGYALADADGRVVVSNDRNYPLGRVLAPAERDRGTPVTARGARVGTFLLLRPTQGIRPDPINQDSPPNFFWPVLRGFLFAGLGLASALLLLAALFARRITRPLRGITAAAQALAAGQLDVQASGARVRELDDLASAFNAMARALAQADRQRRQMTADIAHELRTPLTIIKGRLEGLQDEVYSATPDEIERLLGETALLERLIEDLRLLALAEAGQLPLYPEALDARDLLRGAANAFEGQAAAQGVALRVEASDDLAQVEADPQRMAQVLANLVTNALRYTPSGGEIRLSATVDDRPATTDLAGDKETKRHTELTTITPLVSPSSRLLGAKPPIDGRRSSVVFRISDTGQGIAPEDLPHIFDRFYRADRARARGSGGAGLGLAIARQIVVAHGGTIWAESEPGQGTTISIALPATQGNPQ
jgi:signal transduction histidine kinase